MTKIGLFTRASTVDKRKIWADIERRILAVQDMQAIKAHGAMA